MPYRSTYGRKPKNKSKGHTIANSMKSKGLKTVSLPLTPFQRIMLERLASIRYRIGHNLSHTIRLLIEDSYQDMLDTGQTKETKEEIQRKADLELKERAEFVSISHIRSQKERMKKMVKVIDAKMEREDRERRELEERLKKEGGENEGIGEEKEDKEEKEDE